MNFGKAILRVLRVFGIIILIPVVLALLALLIGFITDLTVSSQWKQAQQESLEYFTRIKSLRYSSGVAFAAQDANAWDYYDRAVKQLDSLSAEEKQAITTLTRDGVPFDIKLAERLTQTYAPALALLDSGGVFTYCAIPYQYEQGPMMPIPMYIPLQNLAKLGVIQGRVRIAQGKPRAAADSYAKVLKMGADIGGGGEVFIGRMVGIVIGQAALKQIALDLDRFDLASVVLLEEALAKLEGNWPSPNMSLEPEFQVYFLPRVSGWNGSGLFATFGIPRAGLAGKIQAQVVLSALSWRSFFSCRKGLLDGLRPNIAVVHGARILHGKNWAEAKAWLEKLDAEGKRASRRHDPASFFFPNTFRMSKRFYEHLAAMRVLKASLAVRESRLEQPKNPPHPESVLAKDSSLFDLANGQPLRVKMVPDGKTIRLYSVGLNLTDDAGEGNRIGERNPDQPKDDIWIEIH